MISSSCRVPPNSNRVPLTDVQGLAVCVYEVEFAKWVFVMKTLIAMERACTIDTDIEDGDAVE